jgi:hypothetical protein
MAAQLKAYLWSQGELYVKDPSGVSQVASLRFMRWTAVGAGVGSWAGGWSHTPERWQSYHEKK